MSNLYRKFVSVASLSLVATLFAATPALADEVVEEPVVADQAIQSIGRAYFPVAGKDYGTTGSVTVNVSNDQPDTIFTVELFGCDGESVQAKTVQGDDGFQMNIDTWARRFSYGDAMPVKLTWDSPTGLTVKEVTLEQDAQYSGEADARCRAGQEAVKPVLKVKKWSSKGKAKAKPGRRLKATPTVSNGSEQYYWTVGGRYAGKGRVLRLDRRDVGKRVSFLAVAKKSEMQRRHRISFGRVTR